MLNILYATAILNPLIFSCGSGRDSQEQKEESTVYERENVEHGRNCSCCTSFEESAKSYDLWLKQRRKRKANNLQALPERDFFDPTCEYWDREDSN
jgi:hypothetical protein